MKSSSNLDEQGRLNNFAMFDHKTFSARVYAPQPQMYVSQQPQFGFTEYAEKLNSRLAMIGFVCFIVLEILTGHGAISFLTSF
jgi:Chlorophyll A-B binding protein